MNFHLLKHSEIKYDDKVYVFYKDKYRKAIVKKVTPRRIKVQVRDPSGDIVKIYRKEIYSKELSNTYPCPRCDWDIPRSIPHCWNCGWPHVSDKRLEKIGIIVGK